MSSTKGTFSQNLYVKQFGQLAEVLKVTTGFYEVAGKTKEETLRRIKFLKNVIENKDGYRIFYVNGQPIQREEDLQILFRLTGAGAQAISTVRSTTAEARRISSSPVGRWIKE